MNGNPNEPQMRVCPGSAGFPGLGNDCDDTKFAIEPGDLVCVTESVKAGKKG